MNELKDIADDVKWKLAARCAATLPYLYDSVFRKEMGDRYEALEHEVWMELAPMAYDIAKDLSLPVSSGEELAHTLAIIMTILFGAGYKCEAMELSEKNGVLIVRRCPLLDHGDTITQNTFHKCMAFTLAAVPLLNKNYTARYVRAMCMGERQCEIKIQKIGPEKPVAALKK